MRLSGVKVFQTGSVFAHAFRNGVSGMEGSMARMKLWGAWWGGGRGEVEESRRI